ncbi:MAG: cytochrome b/b6 domain-containing protein [Rhodospirillales bacterium]|nr:cytochrome b/b6 domain-containing protein [Rhodospirillales bacterium]
MAGNGTAPVRTTGEARTSNVITTGKTMATAKVIRVWDIPTRVFHWSLVLLIAFSFYTGNVGGLREMDLHKLSGYAILALVTFRVVWGVIGSPRSRFADFVRRPGTILAYLRELRSAHRPAVGHNPLGALSVLALLASLAVQAVTGLFEQADIFTKGPLVKYVSQATSNVLTTMHEVNANVLYVLIAAHLAAVMGYLLVKKENLIRPMLNGRKPVGGGLAADDDTPFVSIWRAVVVLIVAAIAVWFVVTY